MLSSSTGQTIRAGITSEEELDVKKMKAGMRRRKRKGAALWWRKWFLQAWTEAVDSTIKERQ